MDKPSWTSTWLGPELENLSSAWLVPSRKSQAKLARLCLPSLILIDAYQFVMSSKKRMTFLRLRLTQLAGESASISNDRIAYKFLSSSPMVTTRSTDSIKERWIKMVATYRYPPLFPD